MNGEDRVVSETASIPGRTVLTGRALHRLAVALVRENARVPSVSVSVSVSLSDRAGRLAASVVVPVAMEAGMPDTLIERGSALRTALAEGMRALAERDVASVDVRFAGVCDARKGRVT